MKKFSSIILSLIIILGTVPLNAQEVVPVISREDLEHYNYVNKKVNKDIKTYHIDNPIAKHKEFMDIVKWKSNKAFDALKGKNSGTYSDKQTAWNMAFFPHIDKEEKYPNSQYFKKPYELYSYALEIYYTNMMEPEAQRIGLKDYRNEARKHIGQIIKNRSQDKNFFANTKVTEGINPMNKAGYLVAYASQINSFYNEVKELKYRKKTCEHPKLYGIEDVSKDVDCQRALALADNYDLAIIQGGAQRIGTFAAIAAEEVEQCLRNVLMQLQTPLIPFEDIDEFLESKKDLHSVDADGNIQYYPESTWQSCGISKNELIKIIADNSMTREEAKKSLKKGVGGKILQGLDYISFSYWVDIADKTGTFENYVIANFGEEKLEELKEEGKEKEEREIAERMAESYNAVLSAIATDLIAYGKIFYYHNDTNLVGLDYDNVPVNASQKFALTWYKMGTDRTQENSPIAKFARGAILQAGGKARNLQNNLFVKTMYDAKVESNIKTNVTILSMAADFVIDPTVLLAPLALVKDAFVARRAIKAADTISDATKLANKALDTTDAIVDATRTTKKLEPVTDLRPKNVQQITGQVSNIPNTPKPLTTPNSVTPAYNVTDAFTDASKGLETAEDFAKTPTPKPEPKTALDPKSIQLTDEFDNIVAKAGNPVTDAVSATNVSSTDHRLRAVWKLEDASGNTVGFAKVGSADEISRTKMVEDILDGNTVQKGGLRKKYKSIEVEYPRIMADDFGQMPKSSQDLIEANLKELKSRKSFRDAGTRLQQSFVTSPVDASGVNIGDLQMKQLEWKYLSPATSEVGKNADVAKETRRYLLQQLDYQPVSKAEWDEVESLIKDLNDAGFHHNDLHHNLFLKRDPKTRKLKVTLLDFEAENGVKDQKIIESWKQGFNHYGLFTEKPVSKKEINALRQSEEGVTAGFKPQLKSTTSNPKGCIGFNCSQASSVAPANTTTGAPEGMRRQIGFGNQGKYIPETAGIRDPNGPGVQNVTKGTPGQRVPDGPSARNPYDVRNQAGGTPDTPGTPQQDLSDLSRQISNEPTTTLERNEGKMLHRERQQQVNALKDNDLNKALDNRGITDNTERYNGRKRLKAEAQKWNIADGKFAGAVKVETKGNKVIVYKADGSKATEPIDDFKYWLEGIPDLNIGITEKERNAIQGLDDVLGVSKGTPTAPHAPTAASTPAQTPNVNQVANATQQTQEAEQLLKGMDNVLKKNYRLSDNIARRANSLNKSLVTGCTDLKSCKQLTEYLADTRELLKSELFELQKAFTQSTGNTNVDAFYKSLLGSSETPKYIKDFLNDTGLRNFVLNNATAPNFGKIADNMLSRSNTDDLARLLKSEVPDNFKSLQQTANADDWKGFISNVQRELEKRLTDFTKLYNNSLDKAAEKAPELIADIRSGKKQLHRTTLRKAVGKQTADDIVDSYREIEKLNEALGNPVNKRGQANIGQAAKRGQKAGETPTSVKAPNSTINVNNSVTNMVKKNERVFQDVGQKYIEMQGYVQQGCKTPNECSKLLAYVIDYRDELTVKMRALTGDFADLTGKSDLLEFINAFLANNDVPHNFKRFLSDTDAQKFLLRTGGLPNFQNLSSDILRQHEWEDLVALLEPKYFTVKYDIPQDFKLLRQIATENEWYDFSNQAKKILTKKRNSFIEQYNELFPKVISKMKEDHPAKYVDYAIINEHTINYSSLETFGIDIYKYDPEGKLKSLSQKINRINEAL